MKSSKSCFDPAVSHMTLRRFYPICILHTVALVLLTIGIVNFGEETTLSAVQSVRDLCYILPLFNLIYALALAQLLLGDLYQTRLSYGLSALPITRGGWFGTQVVLGILSVVPGILISGGMMLLSLTRFRMVIPYYMVTNLLQFLFFFGVAALCAVCAGNRIGMALLYSIVNFGGLFFDWTRIKILSPLIFGMYLPNSTLRSAPLTRMLYYNAFDLTYKSNYTVSKGIDGPTVSFSTSGGSAYTSSAEIESITYGNFLPRMLLFAVVGCVAIFLATRFLRRRKAECTGELLAFRVADPVLVVLCSLFTGILFHVMAELSDWDIGLVLLFIGIVMGYFAALMLTRRRVNVFEAKALPPLGGILLVTLLILTATGLDWFGLASKVPEAEQVESVMIDFRYSGGVVQSDAPEDIALALQIQLDALEYHAQVESSRPLLERIYGDEEVYPDKYLENGDYEARTTTFLRFYMKDGSEICRAYPVYQSDSSIPSLRARFSQPEIVFADVLEGDEPVTRERLLKALQYASMEWWGQEEDGYTTYNSQRIADSDYAALIDAILADCDNGSAFGGYIFHGGETYDAYFELNFREGERTYSFSFLLYPDCTNMMQFAANMGFPIPTEEEA